MKLIYIILLAVSLFFTEYLQAQDAGNLTVTTLNQDEKIEETFQKVRFTLGAGYSRRLGKTLETGSYDVDKIASGLRNGFNIDVEGQYFFKKQFGVGINVNIVRQSGESGGYKETDTMIYIGPSGIFRYENNKWGIYTNLGLGVIVLDAAGKGSMNFSMAMLRETVFGSYCSVSGERRINKDYGIGLKLAISSGTLKVRGMDERLSLSNLSLTAFLSF